MILKKITLRNFKQFRGTQELEFAFGNEGNVTVVYGENGRGKTSLYRALLFCLYGEKQLSQDALVEPEELYLVNYPEMEEASSTKKPVEASVKLLFTHNDLDFELERSIRGMLLNDRVVEEKAGIRLVSWDHKGNATTSRDPDHVQHVVGGILDNGLREYFLFDGEKIERLTRASSDQRREVSAGVRRLLDIDALETATRATDRLKRYLDGEVESRATGELAQTIATIRVQEEKSSRLESRIAELDNELELAEKEKRHIDGELEKIREIHDLLNERANLESKISELSINVCDILDSMKNATGKAALLLVGETTKKVFSEVDRRKQKHEIPSEIRRDLIDKLVSEKRCICGCSILPGSEEERNILFWRSRVTDIATEDSMLNLWRYLGGLKSHYEDISVSAGSLLQKYALVIHEHRATESRLNQIREKIGSSERADAGHLEHQRQQIERKKASLEIEQQNTRSEIRRISEEHVRLLQRRTELEREHGIRDEMSRRAELAAHTSKALKEIQIEFSGEARDRISERASKYFSELLDEEGKQTLRSIGVNSDYSIQVYDRWRKPFLANVSAGQRQIMSIAFIAALASVASGTGVLEMPLFMDTPFGRLSHEHRRNLLNRVPSWCAQWVLLATDTEFGRFEARILRETGCWSRFYVLEGAGAGSTRIRSHSVDRVQELLLRDEAEAH